jgi:hypothetical protein
MTRQAIVRILLSLVLLASQQMASLHVLSHLGGAMGAQMGAPAVSVPQPASDERLAAVLAQDASCSHCLAFAQLAGPLGSSPPAFILPRSGAAAVAAAPAHAGGARTILAFNSRAPPQA